MSQRHSHGLSGISASLQFMAKHAFPEHLSNSSASHMLSTESTVFTSTPILLLHALPHKFQHCLQWIGICCFASLLVVTTFLLQHDVHLQPDHVRADTYCHPAHLRTDHAVEPPSVIYRRSGDKAALGRSLECKCSTGVQRQHNITFSCHHLLIFSVGLSAT